MQPYFWEMSEVQFTQFLNETELLGSLGLIYPSNAQLERIINFDRCSRFDGESLGPALLKRGKFCSGLHRAQGENIGAFGKKSKENMGK